MHDPELTETRTPEPDNLVCNLATVLVQHIDALGAMLGDSNVFHAAIAAETDWPARFPDNVLIAHPMLPASLSQHVGQVRAARGA